MRSSEKQYFLQQVDEVVIPLLFRSWHEVYVTPGHGTDPHTGLHIAASQPVFSNSPVLSSQRKTDNGKNTSKQNNMTEEQRKVWAIQQLRKKAEEVGRMSTKVDFEPIDKIRIKAALGPWPRALEVAGLKLPREKK